MRWDWGPDRVVGCEVLAPAKVNLFFEVLAKREDGFHEIETLMAPIGLYDSLRFEDDPSGEVQLDCQWAAEPARDAVDQLGVLPQGAG